ncbi:MAG: hypothetical protein AB8B96_06620 [Lysobacterales bacterium]
MSNVHRLRELLGIEADQTAARENAERVAEKRRRLPDVAEVLPDAIRQRTDDEDMADAMRKPVARALKESVTENPDDLAAILFPVMGPAIRRSISEALRSALEGLNKSLTGGISANNLKWRMESWRTGVPFREVVMRHTLSYRVTEALLINKENGLLVSHVGDEAAAGAVDRDAVAAMLTAVQDFVADSTGDSEGELSSAELGGRVLWVLTGPRARLALVLDGEPPLSLRIVLRDHLAGMHQQHGTFLDSFEGQESAPPGLLKKMQAVIQESDSVASDQGPAPTGLIKGVLSLVMLAMLAGTVWWVLQRHENAQRWQTLENAVRATPGVVWVNAQQNLSPAAIEVLRDPFSDSIEAIVTDAGFETGEVVVRSTPFISAVPEMEMRRLQAAVSPVPKNVIFSLQGDRLTIAGQADSSWYRKLAAHLEFSSVNVTVDTTGLTRRPVTAAPADPAPIEE